jgi:hypothetical protein
MSELSHLARQGGVTLLTTLAIASVAHAMPPMGGPMRHIEVTFTGTSIELMLEDPGPLMLNESHESYVGPAAALNGLAFNAQYGWMAGGFWTLPVGASVWVEAIASTPGLRTYEAMTFNPIFGTEGSSLRWQWSGVMVHNWYASAIPGQASATYAVYLGDFEGNPLEGYEPEFVTLTWSLVGVFGDLDGDDMVGAADLGILLGAWSTSTPAADLNSDGTVGAADLALLLGAWGS